MNLPYSNPTSEVTLRSIRIYYFMLNQMHGRGQFRFVEDDQKKYSKMENIVANIFPGYGGVDDIEWVMSTMIRYGWAFRSGYKQYYLNPTVKIDETELFVDLL